MTCRYATGIRGLPKTDTYALRKQERELGIKEMPDGMLKDRVAVVTGGASGIGRATALLMARHGAAVYIGDYRLNEENDALFNELGIVQQCCDVRREKDLQELIDRAATDQIRIRTSAQHNRQHDIFGPRVVDDSEGSNRVSTASLPLQASSCESCRRHWEFMPLLIHRK